MRTPRSYDDALALVKKHGPQDLTPKAARAHALIALYRTAKEDVVAAFFAALYATLDTLTPSPDTPSLTETWAWTIGCLNIPKRKKGYLAWLRSSKPSMSDGAYALFCSVRWHRGNGSLWSLTPHLEARKGSLESRAGTLASLILIVTGRKETAVNAWTQALYGKEV